MKILFHANTLNYRGTTVALTDYARYNRSILGNESVITYNKDLGYEKDMGSDIAVINELAKEFTVLGYSSQDPGEGLLEYWINIHKPDLTYFIRAGNKEPLPTNCKTAVHSVFQFNEPHGDKYAYVSEWLSNKMSDGAIPFVPHMVDLPEPTRDYREAFGIRKDQIVIGRYGGYYTFDLPFVKDLIKRIAATSDRYVFLFLGTQPFIDHPNVKFINETHDVQKKANFINTCDAMIHARERGESFGLSIAEFLSLNKPVLAWNNGHDLNHLDMLKDSGLLYNDISDLNRIITSLPDFKEDWTKRVEQYKPIPVMNKFKEVFLS
jgi:glycosyltransferase involved in cell wall biosynthesis